MESSSGTVGTLEERIKDIPAAGEPPVPGWVSELVGPSVLTDVDSTHQAVHVRVEEGERYRHVTAGFGDARGLDILTFQQRVVETYLAVFERLQGDRARHPVRLWAFVPGIHDDLGVGLDRYMVFNAGRYGAYSTYFGPPPSFESSIPTASAVGVQGNQLALHCLAANEPGLPVENPRQIPAYRYSRRFGPMPPCFARATLLQAQTDEPMLLVGGTASITGEESRHVGDLEAQTLETFRNLASVVASSAGKELPEEPGRGDLEPFLATFRALRVYYTRPADREAILMSVRTSFPGLQRAELLQASLCRSELLVEIEGLARPPRRPGA